jgi:hypothetical protein
MKILTKRIYDPPERITDRENGWGLFTSISSLHRGQEITPISMMFTLIYRGMVIVDPLFTMQSSPPARPSWVFFIQFICETRH